MRKNLEHERELLVLLTITSLILPTARPNVKY